jgi:Mce-associated membrane protein
VAEANETPDHPPASEADAQALLEEAEAEAAAAEALAAAAQARARAARLRRKALGLPDPSEYDDAGEDYAEDDEADEADEADDDEYDEYDEDWDEDDYEESVTEQAGWRRRMPMLAAVATVLGIIAFAGSSAYMVLQHRDTTRHQQREAAFVAGAKQGVLNMISLDFNKAKADVQRVIDGSTGEFQADFQQRANDFISVVIQSQAVTEGTVHVAALESIKGNSAVVLVSATSQVTNSPPGKNEPPRMWRLRVTVAEVGGKYKMSKVEYVP